MDAAAISSNSTGIIVTVVQVESALIYKISPEGITKQAPSQVLKIILSQADIKLHLTAWASDRVTVPSNVDIQKMEALKTIALIDTELQQR